MKLIKYNDREEYAIIQDEAYSENEHIDMTRNPFCWERFGLPLSDVILVRDRMQNIYNSIGWFNIKSLEAKRCIAKWLIERLPQSELDEVLSASEKSTAKEDYRVRSRIARVNRWEKLRTSIPLSNINGYDLFKSVKDFKESYLDLAHPDLICWITNGTYPPYNVDHTNNGLLQKPYYTDDLRNYCVKIITEGGHFIKE